MVYSPANFGVLPDKAAQLFCLQIAAFYEGKIAFPVLVVYIVVYIY